MKARFCDECKHHVEEAVFTDGRTTFVLACTLGHKPRFFKPRHINDSRWGWKRTCADFEQRGEGLMTTFICTPQELPTEKVRQIVEAAWHRGFADHAAVQRAGEEAMRKMFGGGECDT